MYVGWLIVTPATLCNQTEGDTQIALRPREEGGRCRLIPPSPSKPRGPRLPAIRRHEELNATCPSAEHLLIKITVQRNTWPVRTEADMAGTVCMQVADALSHILAHVCTSVSI